MTKSRQVNNITFKNETGIVEKLKSSLKESQRVMMITFDKDRRYHGIVDEKELVSLVKNNNLNICEILTSFPYRVYFDIDGKPDLLLTEVKKSLNIYFGNIKLYIMGYETDSKHSYHITTNHYITCIEDLLLLKDIVKSIKADSCAYFDDTVYNKNRAMKCVFQSKPEGAIQLPIEGTEGLHKFFIGSFLPTEIESFQKTIKLPVISKQLKHTVKSISTETLVLPSSISNEDLNSAIKLLELTPINEDNDTHNYRWLTMAFCYSNGITFNQFLEWLIPMNPSKQRQHKLKVCWDLLPTTLKTLITITQYRRRLSQYYPELLEKNINVSKFLSSFDLSNYKTKEINRIEQTHYNRNKRVLVFNIGMGGGKTTTTLEYLKKSDSFIWLAPRQTLVLNTSFRMKSEFGIDHLTHLDVGKKNKAEQLQEAKKLIICNQSLHYLLPNQVFTTVVIDEIETVLNSWKDDETHKDNLGKNFNAFVSIIKNAKKIILLDAFTTTKTFNFLESLGIKNKEIILYTSNYKPATKVLKYYEDETKLVHQICDEIAAGKKLYIFYAFKNGTTKRKGIRDLDQSIKGYIRGKTGTEPTSILYFAESEAKNQLGNINESWAKANYVITTSSITVGVNYEGKDYDKVYLFCSGFANQSRDIIQSSMRIRSPKESEFGIYFFDHITNDYIKKPDYYNQNDSVYNSLIDDVLSEYQCDFDDSLRKFCEMTNYKLGSAIKVLKRKKQNITNEYFESRMLLEYSKVQILNDKTAMDAEERVYSRLATLEERLALDRFYFDYNFKTFTEDDKKYIWNENQRKFFKNYNHNFLRLLSEENGPLEDMDLSNIKTNDEITQYITTQYSNTSVKNITTQIIKTINDILGIMIIPLKKGGKHRGFIFSEVFEHNILILKTNELTRAKLEADRTKTISDLDYGLDIEYDETDADVRYKQLKKNFLKRYPDATI